MRLFYLSFLILLFSCSPDSDTAGETVPAKHLRVDAGTGKGEPHPAQNAANPYDYSGQLFDSLFNSYYGSDPLPVTTATIVARVNKVTDENSQFASFKSLNYAPVLTANVTSILNNPVNCVTDFTNASGLSASGKTRLAGFINGVVPVCQNATDYLTVYNYILAFEANTLQANDLNAHDKEVMLITSSITRYSSYRQRKKPKKKEDPEWDLLMTHLTAGAEGAEIGVCESTARALATGVAGQP